MKPKIRIMMAEDHNSARQAYAAMLEGEDNFVVTGQACNGYELLKLAERNEPDIIISDLEMPVMNGGKLLEIVKIKFPRVKVIFLSMYSETGLISELIISGACAYLSKHCNFNELVRTINTVFTEGYYFSEQVSRTIISSPYSAKAIATQLDLSPREIEVLQLICREKSNAYIASALNIQASTVAFHRKNISRKTKMASVLGMYKYALKNGIVELD